MKIIVIGANNFQLPLIKKAKELGHETHVFAWEKGAVGKNIADVFYPISITEKAKIMEYAKKIKPDGIISIASDLALITVNYIASNLNLIGNSNESTHNSTNKFLMRKILARNNLLCPDYIKTYDINKIIRKFTNFPLIVKPTDRSGSRGVTKIKNLEELKVAINRAKNESFESKIIVEEFIEGKEYSVECVTWKGNHYLLQITEKETTGEPYFIEKGHHQPALLKPETKFNIKNIVFKSLDALEIKYGASHTELLITKDNEIYIVEIGARMGGDYIGSHLVKLSTGYDFLKAVIDISLNNFNFKAPVENYFSGVYFLVPKPGKLLKITDNTENYSEIIEKGVLYNVGDKIPPILESSKRAAYFIYKKKDTKLPYKDDIIKMEVY